MSTDHAGCYIVDLQRLHFLGSIDEGLLQQTYRRPNVSHIARYVPQWKRDTLTHVLDPLYAILRLTFVVSQASIQLTYRPTRPYATNLLEHVLIPKTTR